MNYLGKTGLERIWSKIKAKLENKVDKVTGKGLSTNDYTTAEKTKLSGIATGANKTVIDTALSSTSTNPVQNKVINSALAGKSASSHTHSVASSTANGFMSSTDKSKLDGIGAGANKIEIEDSLNSTSASKALSANQGKILNEKINKKQKVLWDNYMHMNRSQKAYLSEKISEQTNGIVLVFCGYSNGKPQTWNTTCHFIPKEKARLFNGAGEFIPMGGLEGISGYKYLYIYDDRIEGNDKNQQSISNGITYNNSDYVLRYVIGV